MNKAGLFLVVAGLACAAIALMSPSDEKDAQDADAAAPSAQGDDKPGPAGAGRAMLAGVARLLIAPSGWRAWSQSAFGNAAAPGEAIPGAVIVTLSRRSAEPAASPPAVPHDRASLVRALQRGLKRADCYHGPITGDWTREARKAMQALTMRLNAELPVETPDDVLLALVEGQPDNACSAACPTGEGTTVDGRCLPTALLAKNVPSVPVTGAHAMTGGWTTTTAVAPAASAPTATMPALPASDLPEGRMALAGPKAATAPELHVPPATQQHETPKLSGFGPRLFRHLDRMGNY